MQTEKDNSLSMVQSAANQCKSAVKLSPDNQKQDTSGHSSAPMPPAVSQSAAVPSGSPGTRG